MKNNASGRMILQATLCSNGRISDIAVEKYLPYGLVERATELLKRMKFEPALLDGKPVSVRHRQEFFCLEQTCKAVVP
jgi:protein TonB